jgi:signal transduction histidine kinase
MQTLKSVVELKRRIVEDLHPSMLVALGLAASMQDHCEEFTRRTGLPCSLDIPQVVEMDPNWQIALYRILQKSLSNVAQYAKATHVRISLRREVHGIRLQIIDDGIGVAENAMTTRGSYGLAAMRERVSELGGSFTVRAGEGQRGTVVEAYLPLS